MRKIVLVCSLVVVSLIAEELVEPEQKPVSAVSKVMERFSKLSTIESTPVEEKTAEASVVDTTVIDQVSEELELAETVKTAKFESKDVPYPEDKNMVEEKVEKPEDVQPKTQPVESVKREVVKEKSLREIEANARRVIEEEMKKVEEAKKTALERINRAMKNVEQAKDF